MSWCCVLFYLTCMYIDCTERACIPPVTPRIYRAIEPLKFVLCAMYWDKEFFCATYMHMYNTCISLSVWLKQLSLCTWSHILCCLSLGMGICTGNWWHALLALMPPKLSWSPWSYLLIHQIWPALPPPPSMRQLWCHTIMCIIAWHFVPFGGWEWLLSFNQCFSLSVKLKDTILFSVVDCGGTVTSLYIKV